MDMASLKEIFGPSVMLFSRQSLLVHNQAELAALAFSVLGRRGMRAVEHIDSLRGLYFRHPETRGERLLWEG